MDSKPKAIDTYQLHALLRYSYREAIAVQSIQKAFEAAGLWPVDGTKLISVPRPGDSFQASKIISPNRMEKMFRQKLREAPMRVFGSGLDEIKGGFVDTTRSCVLTSDTAMKAAIEQMAI